MTIESDLQSIAKSLATIAEAIVNKTATAYNIPVAPAPVVQVAPVVAPVAVAPVAAPLPVFAAPVPTTPQAAVPFNDGPSLTSYVMAAYKALGPIRGAKIQDVLNSVGCKNINEVTADKYAAIHAGVQALGA